MPAKGELGKAGALTPCLFSDFQNSMKLPSYWNVWEI
jgi:hypothetical protein